MKQIEIVTQPSAALLEQEGVTSWPIWSKEVSSFPWYYDEQETCYLLEGHVVVTPDHGAPVEIHEGDMVTFPSGLACHWDVKSPVRKHYRFG